MRLGQNEHVLKEWNYQTTNMRNVQTQHYLTVTDKRVISHTKSNLGVSTNEIAVNEITGFSASYEAVLKLSRIIMIIVGFLAMLGGLVFSIRSCSNNAGASSIIPGILLVIVGIVLWILGVIKITDIHYYLIIKTTNKENVSLSIGNTNGLRFKQVLNNSVKIQLNETAIKEIIYTLGSLTIAR